MTPTPDEVTHILDRIRARDATWADLYPLIYDELRSLARRQMSAERPDHTLQATALVNEAYMRLLGQRAVDFESRRHFLGAAAEAMRRILVDHARRARSDKRGGARERFEFTGLDLAAEHDEDRLLALDEALHILEREDARAAEVAKMRLFAGLEVRDAAQALAISERTVAREWAYARARLVELVGPRPPEEPQA